jgi:phosphoglycolate phosphatase-like HAD superfamily hydrolase
MSKICIIFDIDGTLVDSTEFEDRLYLDAVRSVLGGVNIRPDLRSYEHVTDSGILRAIFDENRIDGSKLHDEVRQRFGELISDELRLNACSPIPGAIELVEAVRRSGEFEVGIATGGWGHTARMKLTSAGFSAEDIPLASSDDSHERIRIMERCRSHLSTTNTTIYVGDGEWDKRATEALGWRFLGIGERLRGRCTDWVPDFLRLNLAKTFASVA